MKTTKELQFKTQGGMPFTVRQGAKVEIHHNGTFYISPNELPANSIEKHDATYYGLQVDSSDVDYEETQ